MSSTTIIRRAALVAMLGVVAFGAMRYADGRDRLPADSESLLRQRMSEYVEMRLASKWVELYEMTDPEHRRRVDLKSFLDAAGTGVLTDHRIEPIQLEIDYDLKTARSKFLVTSELNVDRLPPDVRKGFRMPEDLDDLRMTKRWDCDWVWRDGAWYFEMDDEMLAGLPSGKGVPPIVER